MKKIWKRYLSWTLPTKISVIGVLLATPLTIIGYSQLFEDSNITGQLNKNLKISNRPHMAINDIKIKNYIDDDEVVILSVENTSRNWIKNIHTSIVIDSKHTIEGEFNSPVHSRKDLDISPLSKNNIAIIPLSQLKKELKNIYPKKKLMEIVNNNLKTNFSNVLFEPFWIKIFYISESNEQITKTEAFWFVLQENI